MVYMKRGEILIVVFVLLFVCSIYAHIFYAVHTTKKILESAEVIGKSTAEGTVYLLVISRNPPVLIKPIPNWTWYQGGGITNAFDLDDYFYDPDNDTLTYTYSLVRNVKVTIDSLNRVSFSTAHIPWWYGTDYVVFTASDGYYSTDSNIVKLTIKQLPPSPPPAAPRAAPRARAPEVPPCIENWTCYPWGPCLPSGKQYRVCIDLNHCGTEKNKPPTVRNCTYVPTCYDGIQNQDETDIDCGGKICPKCPLGKRCKVDEDCMSGYCDPKTKRCALRPRPKVELPKPRPAVPRKPSPFLLFAKYFLWILLLVIAAVFAERLYRKFIAPKIAEWRKKRLLAIARKMRKLKLLGVEADKKLKEVLSKVDRRKLTAKEGVEAASRVVKEYLITTLKIPKEFDYESLCKILKKKKLERSLYVSITQFFKQCEELLFKGVKIRKTEFKKIYRQARKVIKLVDEYKKKEVELEKKKKGLKMLLTKLLSKKILIVSFIIIGLFLAMFFASMYVFKPLFGGLLVYTIQVKPIIANDGNLSETVCVEDSVCHYDFSADVLNDASDKQYFVYSYEAGVPLPTGFNLNSNTGMITIYFNNDSGAGYWIVGLIATDTRDQQKGVGSKPFNLTSRNDEPIISLNYVHCVENNTCYVNISQYTSDEENDKPYWNYTDNTDLFNISDDGIINFTPRFEDWGVYNVLITCMDARNATGSKNVVFNVTPLNTKPHLDFVCDNETNATYSIPFDCYMNATDRENDTLTFSANESWFLIDNSYGSKFEALANFTPGKEAVGNWTINISACDPGGLCDSRVINFTVFNINSKPNITDPANLTAKQGFKFHYEINVTDLDMYTKYGENLTFYDNSTLFNITKSCQQYICYGVIDFFPDLSFNGTEWINFTVCDDEGLCDTSIFNITVMSNAPLEITNVTPYGLPYSNTTKIDFAPRMNFPNNITWVNLSENASYVINVTIDEPDNDTVYYYWYENGSLISTSNSLTRTYGWYDAGSENITLYVSDGSGVGNQNGWEDSFTWMITVLNKNRPPIFGLITQDTLTDFSGGTTNGTDLMTMSGKIILASNGTCYVSNGTYISEVIDPGSPTKDVDMCGDCIKWINISWNATLPTGTSLVLQTRTSINGTNFTNWSTNYINSNGSAIVSPAGRYFQYKVIMNTTSCSATPELDSVTIYYGINDVNLTQGNYIYDWIDLDYFFWDYDIDDNLTFNYSAPSDINISIDSNNVVDLLPNINTSGEKEINFSLYDGYDIVYSNQIVINISPVQAQQRTVTRTRTRTRTRTQTITKNITRLEHVAMLEAKPIVAKEGYFEIPLLVKNTLNESLAGISLEASTALLGVSFSFSQSYLPMIAPGSKVPVTLTVRPPRMDVEFDVKVKAKAASPQAEDEIVVSLTALQINRSVQYVRDLLSANPECLELNEMVEDAIKAIAEGRVEEGQRILNDVIESCRYLIAQKKKITEKPTVITVSRTWIERNIVMIAVAAGLFAFLLGLFYLAYRKA